MADYDVILKSANGEERSVCVKARTKEEAHQIAKKQNPNERVVSHLTKKF